MGLSGIKIAATFAERLQSKIVDSYRLWHVRIDGVEVTQAIQHYRAADHLTDEADYIQDNSVRLVAKKAAWVRVYVRMEKRGWRDRHRRGRALGYTCADARGGCV
jgi:hypothetical protein